MGTLDGATGLPADDEFWEATVAEVNGRVLRDDGGWSFVIPDGVDAAPEVGDRVRYYGRGVGHRVRGLDLNGERVYYRTAEEDDRYGKEQLYGRDCADLLRRWDAGESVFSVSMGGIGPGYEQAIQVLGMEVLRWLVEHEPDAEEWGDAAAWRATADAIQSDRRRVIRRIRPSGAQWGAALHLGAMFYRRGPAGAIGMAPKDRRIQVSREMPSLEGAAP